MPQLHHRDPSIIGLLGASPYLAPPTDISPHLPCNISEPSDASLSTEDDSAVKDLNSSPSSEAFETSTIPSKIPVRKQSRRTLHLEKGQVADMTFERPYYGIIVDGVHCHPNSVRVSIYCLSIPYIIWT